MNLSRFQLAVNHESPEVVLRGLTEFRTQVLTDHDATEQYGYHGRSCSRDRNITEVLLPEAPKELSGLLAEYIVKSPQLEELFVLWSLPGREEDRALCAGHMACIAVVLHFAKSNASVCNGIVSRILCDHLKSLHSQLASGNTELIHATLGLILAMVRTSHQNCKDVFQKLNLSSQTLDSVIQKGKTVNWKCSSHSHVLVTDSRLLVILVVCLVLESVDENAVLELFAEKSLMRKIMHSIGRDSPDTLQIILPGVLHALKCNSVLSSHVHDIFDGATVRQLVLLYSRPEESMQIFGHAFVLQLVDQMKTLQYSGRRSRGAGSLHQQAVSASVSVGRTCSYFAQHLEPHSDVRQQEVLMAVLEVQPHLLGKSISSLSVLKSWEPTPSTEYLSLVRYLSQLLNTATIDHKSKAQLRASFGGSGSYSDAQEDGVEEVTVAMLAGSGNDDAQQRGQAQQSLLNNMVNAWIPPGLTKKDICKMISHKELSLQRVGLELVTALAQRLQRAVKEAGISHGNRTRGGVSVAGSDVVLEHCLAATMQTFLPDFQLLVNMRSRLVKLLGDSTAACAAITSVDGEKHSKDKDDVTVTDDFDFNIEGAEEITTSAALKEEVAKLVSSAEDAASVPSNSVFETLYVKFLELVETYLDLSPNTISAVKFDLLRLLDEYVVWETSQSARVAYSAAEVLNHHILVAILRVLRLATITLECRWFGQQDDAVKMLINLIVAEDWKATMKRTVLMKLMLLAANDYADQSPSSAAEVSRRARSLFKSILLQSGLFVGHTVMDFELNIELNAWLSAIHVSDDSILQVETLLRLSHHWNTPLSIAAAHNTIDATKTTPYLSAIGMPLASEECASLVPFSPVLFCSMLLFSANFELFATMLPKHIRAHASSDSTSPDTSSFFDKFKAQFCESVMRLFVHIVVTIIQEVRSPEHWCRAALIALDSAQLGASPCTHCVDLLTVLITITSSHAQWDTEQTNSISVQLSRYLDCWNTGTEQVAKKSKKGTECVENKVDYNFEDDELHFPDQCIYLVSRWSTISPILRNPPASALPLVMFAKKNWILLHSLLLQDPARIKILGPDYFEWARQQWEQRLAEANGLQAKLCVLCSSIALAFRMAKLVPEKYKWSESTGLQQANSDGGSVVTGFTARITRKRSKSELESENSSDQFASLSLPFLRSVLESVPVLLAAVTGSPIAMQLLFTDQIMSVLASPTWFGDWVRFLCNNIARATVRHVGPRGSGRFTGPMLHLWMNFALTLARTNLLLTDSTESSSLRSLAEAVIKIVDCVEVRKLVVGQSVDVNRLTGLAGLHELTSSSAVHDAPMLGVIDHVTEEVIGVAPLHQLLEASRVETVVNNSPLLCSIFKTAENTIGHPILFMDVRSLSIREDNLLELPEGFAASLKKSTKAFIEAILQQELPPILFSGSMYDNPVSSGKALAESAVNNFSSESLLQMSRTLGKEMIGMVIATVAEEKGTSLLVDLFNFMLEFNLHGMFNTCLAWIVKCERSSSYSTIFNALNLAISEKGSDLTEWTEYCRHLSTTIISAVDDCLSTLASLSTAIDAEASIASKQTIFKTLSAQLISLHAILLIPRHGKVSSQVVYNSLDVIASTLKKKLNKLVRNALKFGLECPAVLNWIRSLLQALELDLSGESPLLLGGVLQPVDDDFYSTNTLFSLLPGHSKFSLILCGVKDHQHVAKVPLLALLLHLTQRKTRGLLKTKSSSKKSMTVCNNETNDTERYMLADFVLSAYAGTLSVADRVSLRILVLLASADMCPAIHMLQPRAIAGVINSQGLRSSHELLAGSARWMIETISPQYAYATLSRFPLWRSFEPQPVAGLETSAVHAATEGRFHSTAVELAWKSSAETMEIESDETQTQAEEVDSMDSVPDVDILLQCSDKVMDPAFYMPAFLHVLRNQEVSVRQMANSGALSLMISCLGSPCAGLRTCALACLQFVQNMLEQQTPTRDAAFRERAQLTLLLSYMRNSFELSSKCYTAPHLPLTTAIFLGRAAMNLMQPNHELFGRVNKYLLCRPFCDVKDVPLYDLLLVNGDAQSDQVQRLAALRLFRDGLLTRQDHLNLCRKNAYNRLMLLFPLLAKDARAGHAVLDLFDRGLGLKYSARYLLERCSLTAWIKLLAAPMGAMQLPATLLDESSDSNGNIRQQHSRNNSDATHSAYYSKYLVRAVTILRRIIASSYLLSMEDPACAVHLQVAQTALTSVVWDAIYAVQSGYSNSLPVEYFAQLVLSMWDLSLSIERRNATKEATVWQEDLLLGLFEAIQLKFSGSSVLHQSRQSTSSMTELQLSILALLRFNCKVGTKARVILDYLRRISFMHLIMSSTSVQKSAGEALAIIRPANITPISVVSSTEELTPHTILDKVAHLPHYTNACDYYAATMGIDFVGFGQFERNELAWSVTASADFSQMLALPTTLGRSFVLSCVTNILAAGDINPENPIDALRWVCLINAAYPRLLSTTSSYTDSLSINRTVEGINDSKSLGQCTTSANVALFLCARNALRSAGAELITPKSHEKLITVLNNITETPVCSCLSRLASCLFNYIAGLVTVHDHPSKNDGAINRELLKSLQSAAENTLSMAAAVVISLPKQKHSNASDIEVSAVTDLLRAASGSEFSPTTSNSHVLMYGVTVYLPSSHAMRVPRGTNHASSLSSSYAPDESIDDVWGPEGVEEVVDEEGSMYDRNSENGGTSDHENEEQDQDSENSSDSESNQNDSSQSDMEED